MLVLCFLRNIVNIGNTTIWWVIAELIKVQNDPIKNLNFTHNRSCRNSGFYVNN